MVVPAGRKIRVLTRALGFGADLAQAANERALWQQAQAYRADALTDLDGQGGERQAGDCCRSGFSTPM